MITLDDFTAEEREYYGIKDTAHLGTLDALVRCRWFRDGWGRAHKARKKPCLQTHEERLWRRHQIAEARTWRAMMAHDAANGVQAVTKPGGTGPRRDCQIANQKENKCQ